MNRWIVDKWSGGEFAKLALITSHEMPSEQRLV